VASAAVHAALLVVLALATLVHPQASELRLFVAADVENEEPLEDLKVVPIELEPLPDAALPVEYAAVESMHRGVVDDAAAATLGEDFDVTEVEAVTQSGDRGVLDKALLEAIKNGLGAKRAGSPDGGLRDESFDEMIAYAKDHGLDVVLAFDSTGSMSGEINNVKQRIMMIGGSLLNKVPRTRIGIVTYRDEGDKYIVHGLPLTDNLRVVYNYLLQIQAGGGGDAPEAVEYGLKWSIANNKFRRNARKVILLFGDAPPHPEDLRLCVRLSETFYHDQYGVISTVTCRTEKPLPEFAKIAKAGGGEAFTIQNSRQLMQELLVLVFGTKHRKEVLEFFDFGK